MPHRRSSARRSASRSLNLRGVRGSRPAWTICQASGFCRHVEGGAGLPGCPRFLAYHPRRRHTSRPLRGAPLRPRDPGARARTATLRMRSAPALRHAPRTRAEPVTRHGFRRRQCSRVSCPKHTSEGGGRSPLVEPPAAARAIAAHGRGGPLGGVVVGAVTGAAVRRTTRPSGSEGSLPPTTARTWYHPAQRCPPGTNSTTTFATRSSAMGGRSRMIHSG